MAKHLKCRRVQIISHEIYVSPIIADEKTSIAVPGAAIGKFPGTLVQNFTYVGKWECNISNISRIFKVYIAVHKLFIT